MDLKRELFKFLKWYDDKGNQYRKKPWRFEKLVDDYIGEQDMESKIKCISQEQLN